MEEVRSGASALEIRPKDKRQLLRHIPAECSRKVLSLVLLDRLETIIDPPTHGVAVWLQEGTGYS